MIQKRERPVLNIGDTVWVFRGSNYGGNGKPWRDLWEPRKVTAVTSRSWVVGDGFWATKVPKAGPYNDVCFTEAEIDDLAYVQNNRFRIGDAVKGCRDTAVLRQIAALIGYVERPQ